MAFIKKEAKNIPLKIESFRTLTMQGDSIKSQMIKSASEVNSARIGRLDLYEEAEDVLEHYKKLDFDIVDEMKKREGNLLWVRARAIDADVPNENGDFFSWEEIIKEREIQSDKNKKKMPAYKTFEGVPIYTNHENTDIQKAKGKVVFAELDEEEKCVYCTFYIDVDAYPDIAKMIQLGTITDVSMGCFPTGTPVMTSEGYKNIEDIHPSELLVDGNGDLTKIRNKQELHYKGPLTEIYIEGGPVIRCTPNHPLFKVKNDNNIKNKNFYNSMHLYQSENIDDINKNIKSDKIESIEAGDLQIGDFLVSPKEIKIDNDEIINKNKKLLEVCSDIENYLMRKISDIKTIDYDGMVYNFEVESDDHTYLTEGIIAKNCQVEFSYCSICGNKAEKESEWCFVPDTLISMGDGSEKKIKQVEIGEEVFTHLNQIKKVIKIYERDIDENILKIKTENCKQPLLITKNHPVFASINGDEFEFINAGELKNNYYVLNNNKNDLISQIEEIHYVGKVYNLEIEDDNSYIANGISVHNCNHLKERKGKRFSGVIDKGKRKGQRVNNELVYEDNHDLKFIELSIVSQGAFENCTVDAILDHNAVLKHANKLRVTASSLKEVIDKNINEITKKRLTASRLEILDYLDDSKNVLDKIDKFSSSVIHNSMQKTSNMNKHAFMNVLDTLNDVLNKIEAVIISLLSRKDNIDLAHVAKISKAMSDLQAVISDLIDDGIGTLADAVNLQQGGQQQAGQQQAGQQAPPQDYTQPGNVGRSMGMEQVNMQTQPVANIMGEEQISNVPFQFMPTLEPAGFEQQNQFASIDNKWIKISNNLQNTNVKLGSVMKNFNIDQIEKEEENLGGSYKMSQLNERVANALMNKISTVVEQPIIASRDNGKFKIVISDKENEEILGYYNGKPTEWQPSSLDSNDIDLIRENKIASVTQKLMDEFVDFVKTAAWNPVTPCDVQEEQVGAKREGNPKDVQEIQIGTKRSGNPKDVQEIQIGTKRSGNPKDVQEHQLQESSTEILGRSGNPEDVQEIQVGGVRKDIDNRVIEHKLQSRRSKASENKIASASLNVLACAVCDSGASPSEIIEAAEEIVEDEKYVEKIASYAGKYNQRLSDRERVEFGLDEPIAKNIKDSLFERIADILVEDEELTPSDIKAAFSSVISAPRESMKKAIGRLAKEQNINVRTSSVDKSREDLIKGAIYASLSDVNEDSLDRSHLKVALFAVAETAEETKATPEEIFEVINNIKNDKEALVILETERLPNSTASRIREKNRKEFWGKEDSVAGVKDIERALFASLADYAETMQSEQNKELPSHLIWQVTKKLASGGENAKILVEAAIEAKKSLNTPKLIKNSASLIDRTDTVREIRLSMDEIPEVDPSSEEFVETVRDYTIAFLQNKGYQVDPETFNFTKLIVNDKAREIVAIVQSSIVKEFDDEPFTMKEAPVEESGMGFAPSNFDETLITPMAMKQRKNRRDALVREAQAAPAAGGAPAAPPMGRGMGGEMGTAPMSGEDTAGPGLSSLMGGDDEAGGLMGEDEDLDNISSPGDIKPIGTICPACGSTNVDLAAGKGECSDCHTKFEVKISLDNIVIPDETEGQPKAKGKEEELGKGLGAELAPLGPEEGAMPGAAPAQAAGPGTGGAAAPAEGAAGMGGMPLAASIRWYGDATQFVKLAREKTNGLTDAQIYGPKPPGTVCVACGNKSVRRANSKFFCDKCGTIGKINVAESKKYDNKLIYTVSYLLPPMEKLSYKGNKNLKSKFVQFNDKERAAYNRYKDGEISLEELKKVSPRVYNKAKSMNEEKGFKDFKNKRKKIKYVELDPIDEGPGGAAYYVEKKMKANR